MVMNTVHATYTETYDLNTAINEVSLIGIHTPQANALKSMYKGFFENYKKYKIVGCNLGLVCASSQSLTPDQVGLTSGSVDPRDVLNPILFKACTGENLNEILNQIYSPSTSSVLGVSTSSVNQRIDSTGSAINMYYQLLSDDSWRKEHPQRGLFIKGLKPLVHKIVTTQPFRWTGAGSNNLDYPRLEQSSSTDPTSDLYGRGFGGVAGQPVTVSGANVLAYPNVGNPTTFISDGTVDMPWLDTTYDGSVSTTHITGSAHDVRSNNLIVSVPRVFCGCIVLPPAILQRLFFRCQIQWHIMFKDFRPAFEVGPIWGSVDEADLADGYFNGETLGTPSSTNPTYWNIYHDATTKLDKEFSSFDVNGGAEVEQVMESAQ